MNKDSLIKLADFYGVSIDYLLGREEDEITRQYSAGKIRRIPVIGKIRAGYDGLAVEDPTGFLQEVPDSIVRGYTDELTKPVLLDWQEKLWTTRNPDTGEYYSYEYLNVTRAHLSAFLTWAAEKYDTLNNLPSVKKPKRRTATAQMQFWTREEFDRFISVVDDVRYRAIFSMLFFTGRRKGEVLALNAADVKPDKILFDKTYTRKTIDGSPYQITTTKNEKRDWTIIAAPLKKVLADYTPEAPFYFGGKSPIHENTVAHAFDRYIEKAGVKRIRIHDLRHSFVSLCIHLGANVYVVASLIGDKPEQVLKTYGHLWDEDRKTIIAKIM